MKRRSFLVGILLLLIVFVFASCNSNDNSSDEKSNTNEIYMNQKGSWSNGVEFSIYNHKETSELDFGLYKYTTNDKFLVIGLRVYNGSSEVFAADGTDVWLLMGETKIYQQNIVERHVQGYDDISQSPTVTKDYFLFFEIGNNVSMSDLKLVINNGGFFDSESLVINLKNALKESLVTLNLYDNETKVLDYDPDTILQSGSLPIPQRDGYRFLGWYLNSSFDGDMFAETILKKNENFNLYAKWEKNKISITYDGNGNTGGSTKRQIAEVETQVILSENGFTKDGYYFVGWTKTQSDNNVITPSSLYEITLTQSDFTLYAKWAKNIESVEDFSSINEHPYGFYYLQNDIDFTGFNYKAPVRFYGIFDGNGYKIENINSPFVINNYGIIESVKIINCVLDSSSVPWITYGEKNELHGILGGIVLNDGTIRNVLISSSMSKNIGVEMVGGLVGVNTGCIESSVGGVSFDSSIGIMGGTRVGGFCGLNYGGTIINSYSTGDITLDLSEDIQNSLLLGGFCGEMQNGTIEKCYTNVKMTVNSSSKYSSRHYGGFIAKATKGNITDCVSISEFLISESLRNVYAGGFIAVSKECIFKNCCYDSACEFDMLTYVELCFEGTPKSIVDMKSKDFWTKIIGFEETIWIIENNKLPVLYCE